MAVKVRGLQKKSGNIVIGEGGAKLLLGGGQFYRTSSFFSSSLFVFIFEVIFIFEVVFLFGLR